MFLIFQVDLSSAQPIEVSVCVLRCFSVYAPEEFLSEFGAAQLRALSSVQVCLVAEIRRLHELLVLLNSE